MKTYDYVISLRTCPVCEEILITEETDGRVSWLPTHCARCINKCLLIRRWRNEPKLSLIRKCHFGTIDFNIYSNDRDPSLALLLTGKEPLNEVLKDKEALALIRLQE